MILPNCPTCDVRTDTGGICRNCMNRNILYGDVLDKLKEIPDGIIDCIISSPPYWGLRDYGVDGQLGLESDFKDYLKKMSDIMVQLKRVLKSTGTCWINLGDCYGSHRSNEDSLSTIAKVGGKQEQDPLKGYTKSRIGIPERFYINCIDDGWIARNHIPWYKSNSMPSSVKDRFSNKWESIFFFAKNQKYYFNLDAVREKTITESKPFNVRVRDSKRGLVQEKLTGGMSEEEDKNYNKSGELKQDNTKGADGKPIPTYEGFNVRWNNKAQDQFTKRLLEARAEGGDHDSCMNNPKGKNPGDVFFINPRPFAEAHFATFPVDLPLKILKCACPPDGIVLDPFFGAGTVGVAAEQLGLQWIGIELNKEYITIARNRLAKYKNNSIASFV